MNKTIPLLLIIALFAAAAWYFFTAQPAAVHELPPPPIVPVTPVAEPPPPPTVDDDADDLTVYREPEPIPEPLPPLVESDPEVTQALAEIVGTDPLAKYLVKSQAISRMVATTDSLTSRQVPAPINPVRPASGVFQTDYEGENVVMSTENFSRYDGHVALIQETDTDALLALYHRYYPLFQQAWEENGGEGSFNQRLVEVIDHLLETPDVPGPVYLTKPEAVYLYAEPELESMTAGQKILVRMGSVNAAVVKEKLTEIKLRISNN